MPVLFEHRATAAGSAVEFTKGWIWGAAGYDNGADHFASVTAAYEKNDCDRTRKPWTAIRTAAAG